MSPSAAPVAPPATALAAPARTVVHKFGGTSVADAERYRHVAQLLLARDEATQVTVVSACCTCVGIALIALWAPSVVAAVVTALVLMLGYALDSADGQLARLRHGGSRAGEWLDHVADVIKLSTIHLAIAVSIFRFSLDQLPGAWVLLLPLVFSAVQNTHFFSYILTYQLRHGDHAPLASGEGRASFLKSVLSVPTDYGLLCLVMALRFAPVVFLWVYGLMLVGFAAYLGLALPKWYLELRRQG